MDFPYHIRYWADLNPGSGYNNAARGYLCALKELGLGPEKVHLIPAITSSMHAADVDQDDWLSREYMQARDWPDRADVNIVHLHPPLVMRHWALGWYNVALCAWELDRLPDQKLVDADNKQTKVVDALNEFDEIWVPREQTVKAFRKSGVTVPMFVIPHALLPELLAREPKPRPKIPELHPIITNTQDNAQPLKFYFIGSWDKRKNVAGLVESYLATGWDPSTPTELLLHCVPPSRDYTDVEQNGFMAQEHLKDLLQSTADPQSNPNLVLNVHPKSYKWILDLHEQSHVFVTASNGEGFCLPALEAAAMGNIVIGGNDAIGHLADALKYVVPDREARIKPMPHMAGYELGMKWREPDPEALTEAMKDALREAQEHRDVSSIANAHAVREAYSPKAIAEILGERIEYIKTVLDGSGW